MRILHTKDGKPLVKAVAIKIFHPGNKKVSRRIVHAPPGQAFHAEGVDQILERTSEAIEKQYPNEEYGLVVVGPAAYNFVHRGEKDGSQISG